MNLKFVSVPVPQILSSSAVIMWLTVSLSGQAVAQTDVTSQAYPEEVHVSNAAADRTLFPAVRGTHHLVAGGNNFVTEAGLRMLRAGGNAVDAGVAATLAAAVTEEDHFSMGGEMPVLIKMKGKPVQVVSGVGGAPRLATPEFYNNRPLLPWEADDSKPPIPTQGILAATVPGMVDGALLALQQFGTMTFAEVAAPAIALADAFPTTEILAETLRKHDSQQRQWPTGKAYFYKNDRLPQPGELFRQPQLAATLRAMIVAEQNAGGERVSGLEAARNYFYRGPVASEIGRFSEANGGLLRYEDIAAFHAELDTPRSTTFHGYEIVKPGFWTQGPVMLEMFNLLEGYDLKAMGHNSPEYLHTLVEAAKLAFADRDLYYGDPKFAKVPEQQLLSKAYAAQRVKLIDPQRASLESRPGNIAGYQITLPEGKRPHLEVKDTTCVAVVDDAGNVFSATPSGAWLPSVMAGNTGIAYGSRLQSFVLTPGHPNELQAGKRPRVTLSPTLILKDGEPLMAVTTPGGDNQDQAMLQVILNMLVFGMPPQRAVEAPRFQTDAMHASFGMHDFKPGALAVESRIAPGTAQALRDKGHKLSVRGPWSNAAAPVVIKLGDGVLEGGADPRRGRFVYGQ